MHALGLEFGSAAQLSKRTGSVWNCLWGNALKRSPRIIRKSRVSYPGPAFLSNATWPSLPKKHYNGLNLTKLGHSNPHTKEASSVLLCVRISVTSRAQLATITSSYSCCKLHFIKVLFYPLGFILYILSIFL